MNNLSKLDRILEIFFRAIKGEDLSVKKLASDYGVSTKTISRDINDLRIFMAEKRELLGYADLKYSYQHKVYRFYMEEFLTDKELLSLVKILAASRAFHTEDMNALINKLERFSQPDDSRIINNMIRRERHHYSEVHSDVPHVTDTVWQIANVIENKKEITITYYKMDRSIITRRVIPAAVMFSEYYFYMIAFHKTENGDQEERFYRIDRIREIIEHRDHTMRFKEFDEGELRNLNQFMFPGQNRRIVFEFTGPSVQAVLDRLPTAKLINFKNGVHTIEAHVYGDGIKMWLLSQGDWIKVLEPYELAEEIKQTAQSIINKY